MSIAPFALAALLAADDVGVDEKLGQVIPADIALRDEDGKPAAFGDIVDRPTILTLNYFRCAGICTPLLNGVADAVDKLPLEPGSEFRVVTVSFDPRDTAEMAAEKRRNYLRQLNRPFPPAAWRFLTGDGAATKRLCDAVGFKFRAQGEDYIHPGVIAILSPARLIASYDYGTQFLPADLEMSLRAAARGQVQPTAARTPNAFSAANPLSLICFSYDPRGNRVFSITKTVGFATVVVAAAFAAWLALKGRGPAAGKGGDAKEAKP